MHTTPAQLDMDNLIQLASGTMALGTKRRTRGRLREGAESYAKALASDILR